MGRKRQRSRAALTDDDEQAVDVLDESESIQDQNDSNSLPDETLNSEEERKELDVWDAFREEHHEVLEQLPLSLQRQFKLMRELDSQSGVFHTDLLSLVRQYIQLRESLAVKNTREPEGANTTDANNINDHGADTSPNAIQVDSSESTQRKTSVGVNGAISASPNTFQPKLGDTTRTLLQCIAQTSEEAIRTVEEKVNIAQTAYETVDRHIRLLDQAIKEQEATISLGVRPGTHLAPILLPDLVVPRWARPPRVENSPVPSLSPEPGLYFEEPPVEHPPPQISSPKASKKKKTAPKPTKPDNEGVHAPSVVGGDELAAGSRTRRTSVRLTIPAQPLVEEPPVPVDPNEDRYCYCNQVSFGMMIACDGKSCRLSWFHFGCTGLVEVPSKKAKWYCRECKPKMTHKGRTRA